MKFIRSLTKCVWRSVMLVVFRVCAIFFALIICVCAFFFFFRLFCISLLLAGNVSPPKIQRDCEHFMFQFY